MRELSSRMDAHELGEWMAYYEFDPFGNERADLHAGIVAAATIAPHAKRGHRPKPADYIPKFGRRYLPKPDIMKQLRAITAMMGGTIVEAK